MRSRATESRCAGFTLVEILAVMAILGLLFTLAMPMISNTSDPRTTRRSWPCGGDGLRGAAVSGSVRVGIGS